MMNSMKLRESLICFLIVSLMLYLLLGSCANTSTPPLGGPKDTIPPVLLKVLPDSGEVNFPQSGGTITLTFDEYVVLAEEQKNIYLSPPQTKIPKTKIKGKSIIVRFEEQLDSNTTYLLNFGNAIKDNNEGNLFSPYSYPFSTDSIIDSMVVSGVVMHSETLLPAKGVTVALYFDHSDSAVLTKRPDAIAKSDEFGYFVVRNIKPLPYSLYAFEDLNYNNRCDIESELIAFLDTLYTPITALAKGLPQLAVVEEKDTLAALSRPVDLELYLFREENDNQYIREVVRVQDRMFYISFAADNAQVDSLSVEGVEPSSLLVERNVRGDSLVCWIGPATTLLKDSLFVTVDYQKSDSLGQLVPHQEEFTLPPLKREKLSQVEQLRRAQEEEAEGLTYKLEADPNLFEERGFTMTFDSPLNRMEIDSIEVLSESPRGQLEKMKYSVTKDSLWSRIVTIMPQGTLRVGYDYKLTILPGALEDLYNLTNDTIVKSVKLPTDDRLSTLKLDIVGVEGDYIVELTNITRDRIFRSHRINRDTLVLFPYLSSGKYSVKIVEDINGNGIIDTGSLKLKKQPEKVRLYTLPDGKSILTIKEATELIQEIDLRPIFGYKEELNEELDKEELDKEELDERLDEEKLNEERYEEK